MKEERLILLLALMAAAIGATAVSLLVLQPWPRSPAEAKADKTDQKPAVSGGLLPSPEPREPSSFVAPLVRRRVVVRRAPSYRAPAIASFSRRTALGGPQVFLVAGGPGEARATRRPGGLWYRVLLPIRPNGTTGFLPASAVRLSATPYRLVVERARFRLKLFEGSERVATFPVGIGTGATPTPVGRFYLASLLRPPTAGSIYGTYAYGLSGYSDVITDWEGGGIIGLHGTNDPSSVGRAASHGCIRMRNPDIERLVRILPLGTPIEIR